MLFCIIYLHFLTWNWTGARAPTLFGITGGGRGGGGASWGARSGGRRRFPWEAKLFFHFRGKRFPSSRAATAPGPEAWAPRTAPWGGAGAPAGPPAAAPSPASKPALDQEDESQQCAAQYEGPHLTDWSSQTRNSTLLFLRVSYVTATHITWGGRLLWRCKTRPKVFQDWKFRCQSLLCVINKQIHFASRES